MIRYLCTFNCITMVRTENNRLFFTCDSTRYVAAENVIPEHGLAYIFEGELETNDGVNTVILKQGDCFFASRNSLFRFRKLASPEKQLKTVAIPFSQSFLQGFYSGHPPQLSGRGPSATFRLKPNPLWTSLFSSLQPYLVMQDELPDELCLIKVHEALAILRSLVPGIDQLLADFSMPGKIDLEEFMQKNFVFNLPLERFAYLSGRSLSSFKRDFNQIFKSTPQRWLTHKRLEQAHYLISSRETRPSEAFVEVGFENFSHFSAAFKSHYGYSPSQAGMNV